jgi:serine/threonine-protein kinase
VKKSPDLERTKIEVFDPMKGAVIAERYRIELKIASGGFGAIYRALDLLDDRDVALKLLHPRLASDPAVIARFRREGAALRALKNPHTVTAFDVGETRDGMLFIAMELLEGESLFDHFRKRGPLPWRRMAQIARAVCDALAEAHALGIIHRDLKPANIHLELRGGGGFVKVLDFGIAKIIQGSALDDADLTHAGQMIGTFDYMPPEQMVGGELSGESDIFTLGIVMYEMITGELPFGAQPTAAKMLASIVSTRPRPPSALADVPPELDRIILRCLARKPQDRYAGIGELSGDLDRLLEPADEPTLVRPRFVQAATLPGTGPHTKKR